MTWGQFYAIVITTLTAIGVTFNPSGYDLVRWVWHTGNPIPAIVLILLAIMALMPLVQIARCVCHYGDVFRPVSKIWIACWLVLAGFFWVSDVTALSWWALWMMVSFAAAVIYAVSYSIDQGQKGMI